MSSNSDEFDLVVIGSGPAGYVAAIRAAQLGMRTACVEKEKTLGGTCLNVGCIPSKALLDSSEHFFQARTKFDRHGIIVKDVGLNLPQTLKRKDSIVRQLTGGIDFLFKKNRITRLNGYGKILDARAEMKTVQITGATEQLVVKTKNILIATGSVPVELPFMPFDGKRVVSSTEALSFPEVPKHLVVIGGGVIGLELGSVWLRFGARVTVVEFQDRILPGMDTQTTEVLFKILKKEGMDFRLQTKCLGASPKGEWLTLEAENLQNGEKLALEADRVLVSVGRRPYTEGVGLEENGIAKDNRGRVVIDRNFQTNLAGVYAVGDVVDGPMLAHKGEEEAVAAVEIMAGQDSHVKYEAIPNVVYTWPEVASVGFEEAELKQSQVPYKVGTFPFMANGRAKAMDEVEGLVKILSHKGTDRLLGVHIVGPRASDMIAEAVAFVEMGSTADEMARTCHAHPTLAEVMKEAALAVNERQIHL